MHTSAFHFGDFFICLNVTTYVCTYLILNKMYGTAQRQCHKHSQFISSNKFVRFNRVCIWNAYFSRLEVNTDVATESYATECNRKDKATRIWNFVVSQA